MISFISPTSTFKNTKIKLENCLELRGPVPQHNIRRAVWIQSQHGGNGGRKNRLRC